MFTHSTQAFSSVTHCIIHTYIHTYIHTQKVWEVDTERRGILSILQSSQERLLREATFAEGKFCNVQQSREWVRGIELGESNSDLSKMT